MLYVKEAAMHHRPSFSMLGGCEANITNNRCRLTTPT